ncbi:MAG: hypothetical protein R3Y32_00865 [Bacillota bacterium]
MHNRICKSIIAFTLAFAVFFAGTVFCASPKAVYGASVNTSEQIFGEGSALYIESSGSDTVVWYYDNSDREDIALGDLSYTYISGGYDDGSSYSSGDVFMSGGSVSSINDADQVTITGGSVSSIAGNKVILQGGTINNVEADTSAGIVVSLLDNLYITGTSNYKADDEYGYIGDSTYGITSFDANGYKIYVSEEIQNGDVVAYFNSALNAEDYLDYFVVSNASYQLVVENNAIVVLPTTIYSPGYTLHVENGVTSGNSTVFYINESYQTITLYENKDLSNCTIDASYYDENDALTYSAVVVSGGNIGSITNASTVEMCGGEVGDISADYLIISGGTLNGSAVDMIDGVEIYIEESNITLAGDSSYIGSQEVGITSYSQDEYASYTINVTSENRSVGDVVAYASNDISKIFSSEYYTFEGVENEYGSGYTIVINSLLQSSENSSGSKIEISPEFTVGGADESGDGETTSESEEDISDYDNISIDNGKYIVDGKYGGTFDTLQEAIKASKEATAKEESESDVADFESSTFTGTGLEDDEYSETLYQEQLGHVEETAEGTYIYDGEEYDSIEDAVSAVAESVKQESYSRKIEILTNQLASSVRYCDDEETASLYAQGATAISQLAYSSADRLAEIYTNALDTISVSQNAQTAGEDIFSVYNLLSSSGVLTQESMETLESEYQGFIDRLSLAETNSEVAEIKSDFEDFISSLDVTKIFLTDSDGNVTAVIYQSGGMAGSSQIVLSNITDTSAYQQLFENLQSSGDVSCTSFFSSILGGKNNLSNMEIVSVVDLSINGEHGDDSSGKYTVQIQVPENIADYGKIQILHITDSGVELIWATVANGYVVWETTSFSEFIIIGGDGTSLWFMLIPLGIIAMLIVAYFIAKKKEERGAKNGKQ